MDRFDRQTRIRGWRQEQFENAIVVVHGRTFAACWVVWGLATLGVGQIVWIGRPDRLTDQVANWLLADPCPFDGCVIVDYPCAVEYGGELDWILADRQASAVVDCSEDAIGAALCEGYARKRGLPFLVGTTAAGGWVGQRAAERTFLSPAMGIGRETGGARLWPSHCGVDGKSARLQPRPTGIGCSGDGLSDPQPDPVVGMVLAALLIEAVRECLCPLFTGRKPREGDLHTEAPAVCARGTVVLIGVGGIGVYAAVLAAQAAWRLVLVDLDHVEETNLNRQGLFTSADAARRAPKAEAAARALRSLFPGTEVSACVGRVDRGFKDRLAAFNPSVLLSAVDNAATRLVLQSFGRDLGVPVIQGGTDVFAADCFSQDPDGPLLDEQLHGAMAEAAAREASQPRRHGTCAADPSYVVPGMICGSLMIYRMRQALDGQRALGPIRWRAGELPKEQNKDFRDEFDFAACNPR